MMGKSFSTTFVQKHFGMIMNIVISGESVIVTRYGKPVMMILPYMLADEVMREYREGSPKRSRATPA